MDKEDVHWPEGEEGVEGGREEGRDKGDEDAGDRTRSRLTTKERERGTPGKKAATAATPKPPHRGGLTASDIIPLGAEWFLGDEAASRKWLRLLCEARPRPPKGRTRRRAQNHAQFRLALAL